MGKKVLSIIIVLFLFPMAFAVFLSITAKTTVLNKEFVKKELAEQKIYEKIYNNFPEFVNAMDKKGEEGEEKITENPLFRESMILIAQKVLLPEDIKNITETVIDGAWPWLFEGKDKLLLSQSVVSQKQKAKTEILNFFRDKYNSLRVCRYGEQFTGDIMSANACRPSGITFERISEQFGADQIISEEVFAAVPDDINPEVMAEKNQSFAETFFGVQKAKPIFDLSGLLIYIVPALLLVALVFLGRLGGGSWGKMPMMLGIYFIVLGGLSFLAGKIVFGSVLPGAVNLGTNQFQDMPKVTSEIILPFANNIIQKTSNVFISYIYIFLFAGALLFAGSFIFELFSKWHVRRTGWSLRDENIKSD